MNKISEWKTEQLDASQEYIIQAYNRLAPYFSLILLYANGYFEDIRLQILAEAEILRTVIDPAIEDLEDLREFLHDIEVKDDSIIDIIEDMYERGGDIIDSVIERVEHAKPPAENPCADMCDCDVNCDFNSCADCSDSSDDYFCDCYTTLCIEGITDEDRSDFTDKIFDTVLPECFTDAQKSDVVNSNIENLTKEAEDAAREAQARQDAAAREQQKADELKDLASRRDEEAKEAGKKADDAMGKLHESVQPGNIYDRSTFMDFMDVFTPGGNRGVDLAGKNVDRANGILDSVREDALQAAADVLEKGGTLEEAKDAYDRTFNKGRVDNIYLEGMQGITRKDGRLEEVTNADKGLIEDAFNALQEKADAEQSAWAANQAANSQQSKADAAQDLADKASQAAQSAQNTLDEARNEVQSGPDPDHRCDCHNPVTGCPDAYNGPECNTCDGCYDSAGGCADCFGTSDTPCDYSCDCSDSSCDSGCDSCGDCDCDSCTDCDCDGCSADSCSADSCSADCADSGCDWCICDSGGCVSCFS